MVAGAAVWRAAEAPTITALPPFAGRSDTAFCLSVTGAAGRGFCARGPFGAAAPAVRGGCSGGGDFGGLEDLSVADAAPASTESGFSGARAGVTRGGTTARLLPLGGGSDPVTAAYPLLYSA